MVKLGDRWDYECFCKKGHVSYSTLNNASAVSALFEKSVNLGGYREDCEEFDSCTAKERVESGVQEGGDDRYKVFVPEEPLAWEAAKQMVRLL